jgi:class 3 adenylate cyclase
MTGLRDRFLRIGVEAADDEETRLRKLLLLLTASIVGCLAVLWGGLYWAFDEPVALAGDQVMAIFNAPQPHPDHALRAVRAALNIQAAIADVSTEFAPAPPQFGIGINTGPALVGNIGSEEFRNFTAIGDTTNTAARLQAIASSGGIVVGPVTARMLATGANLVPLGAVTVKGKPEPIEVCSVLGIDGMTATAYPPDRSTSTSRAD